MTRKELRQQYEALEDQIERSSLNATWALADWLADNVPLGRGGPGTRVPGLTIKEIASWGRSEVRWLNAMRRTALDTREDRVPNVPVRVYQEALLKAGGDLVKANRKLHADGMKLRDHAGRMESPSALLEAASKHTPEERARLAADLLKDEQTQVEATRLGWEESAAIRAAGDLSPEAKEKSRRARERGEQHRRAAHSVAWVEADGDLTEINRRLRKLLDLVRGVEFNEEEVELLTHDIGRARAVLGLVEVAISGSTEVDWDTELARLSEED